MAVGHPRGKALSTSCMLIECDILVSFWEHQPRPGVWTNAPGMWVKQREEEENRVKNLGEQAITREEEEERSHIQKFRVPPGSPPQITFTRRVHACWVASVMPDSVHGILQARILERVAIPSSRGPSQPRDRAQVSCTVGGFFFLPSELPGKPYQSWGQIKGLQLLVGEPGQISKIHPL